MAGTKRGGKQAADTNRELYGDDFYKRIGAKGGKKGWKDGAIKGFAAMTYEERSAAGKLGGSRSRRGKANPS